MITKVDKDTYIYHDTGMVPIGIKIVKKDNSMKYLNGTKAISLSSAQAIVAELPKILTFGIKDCVYSYQYSTLITNIIRCLGVDSITVRYILPLKREKTLVFYDITNI